MLQWIRLSAARSASVLALAALAGLSLASCGGGNGDGNVSFNNPGSTSPCAEVTSPVGLEVRTLRAGSKQACAEVASTPEQRAQGLMNRQGLAADSGMLFDFSEPTSICMWMRDTTIPLSIAFIDQGGLILNIADMEPLTTDLHCSSSSARYALEMQRGWFEQSGVTQGIRVSGLP